MMSGLIVFVPVYYACSKVMRVIHRTKIQVSVFVKHDGNLPIPIYVSMLRKHGNFILRAYVTFPLSFLNGNVNMIPSCVRAQVSADGF